MILIGGAEDGFVSFEEMLKDAGDLFNENIDVIMQIISICNLHEIFCSKRYSPKMKCSLFSTPVERLAHRRASC